MVIVFLFPLNVDVSPCFHCIVLWVYTSCFHNTVVSSCYRLHTFRLHHAGVTSCLRLQIGSTNWKCLSVLRNINKLKRLHFLVKFRRWIKYQKICCSMMGLGANFTMREVASIANSCPNCRYDTYQDTFST